MFLRDLFVRYPVSEMKLVHDCVQVYGSCSDFIDLCVFDEVYVQYEGGVLSVA